jgi:hypothetical protein
MGTLVQVLTREYSEHGVHVANVVIDGNHRLTRARALRADRWLRCGR